MCLAEALLRIPDAQTRDDLIYEKLERRELEISHRQFQFILHQR